MKKSPELWKNHAQGRLCGMDEAGRGPLAGPVSAGAVILDPARPIPGLADSKVLKAQVRDELALQIRERALAWGHAFVWPDQIEAVNIHNASLLAMKLAFQDMLTRFPGAAQGLECAVSDGKFHPDLHDILPGLVLCSQVKGDALVAEISAASIIAKTERDAYMIAYAREDDRYGFEKHMGYPTPEHRQALMEHGPCPIHRLSWVKKTLAKEAAEAGAGQGELLF